MSRLLVLAISRWLPPPCSRHGKEYNLLMAFADAMQSSYTFFSSFNINGARDVSTYNKRKGGR